MARVYDGIGSEYTGEKCLRKISQKGKETTTKTKDDPNTDHTTRSQQHRNQAGPFKTRQNIQRVVGTDKSLKNWRSNGKRGCAAISACSIMAAIVEVLAFIAVLDSDIKMIPRGDKKVVGFVKLNRNEGATYGRVEENATDCG